MKLGVAGMIPSDNRKVDEEALRKVREAGFSGCSLFLPAAAEVSGSEIERLRTVFGRVGLRVAQVNARYHDLVQPDESLRCQGIHTLRAAIRVAAKLAADTVYVRPGSLNPAGSWSPHPANTAEATLDRLAAGLTEVCHAAEELGVRLALEGHVVSPLETPERMREMIERVGSPALGFNADPVNFIGTLAEAYDTAGALDHLFDTLGAVTAAAHAKDVTVGNRLVLHIDETVPGRGLLDLAHFLRRFEQACPSGYVLIEHLRSEEVPEARQALLDAAAGAGLEWELEP